MRSPRSKACAVYPRVNLNRGLRAFCFGRPAILFGLWRRLFSIRLRRFRSAALVIFHVLAERADDALFAADGGFEFLVQAGKCTPVVSVEGVEHGFGEVLRESAESTATPAGDSRTPDTDRP